ncbi:MAG: ferrochelatase [Cyclobacteriaceae bacterium]
MIKSKPGKKGVLLVNLGTPDSPSVPDVRKYLREFLMDGRVIDFPFIPRWMLVNLIIAPFRSPKSAKIYKQLWEERGSPLMFHSQDVRTKLQALLGSEYIVALGMRYQQPSIESALQILRKQHVSEILVIPLFPQYASATTGSVIDKVMEITKKWQVIPNISFVSQFHEHELFIESFAQIARKYLEEREFDHILFSYHGIPERQIKKASVDNYCRLSDQCCSVYHAKNRFCYRAQCFQTTRLLAESLNIPDDKYTVVFQSRLGKDPWIKPYADETIKQLAQNGIKSILIFSAAFVADCLETTIEVGDEFKEIFEENGGEHWQMVESLNSNDSWVACLQSIVLDKLPVSTHIK